MKIKCIGCGAIIQTTEPNKSGYIDEKVLQTHEQVYCKRCFRLKHYNQNTEIKIDSEEYRKNLEEIKKNPGLIVNVVDLFNLEATLIKDLNQMFKTENILLVANKVDLFLNSININKVKNYLQQYLAKNNLKVKDVIIISSFKKDDIASLIAKILELKKSQNVYFIGATNVGKSSIINQIIAHYENQDDLITVSNMINTTLGNIYIPFADGSYLVDTPGIIIEDSINNYLDKSTLEGITPKSFVRPKTFQLNPSQTLFIAGFARIDFIQGEKSSFITNFNNDLIIHRTKIENASSFYQNHYLDILKYPNEKDIKLLGKIKKLQFNFTKEEKIDIVISGLGYITISGEGNIDLYTFSNINIIKRKAII